MQNFHITKQNPSMVEPARGNHFCQSSHVKHKPVASIIGDFQITSDLIHFFWFSVSNCFRLTRLTGYAGQTVAFRTQVVQNGHYQMMPLPRCKTQPECQTLALIIGPAVRDTHPRTGFLGKRGRWLLAPFVFTTAAHCPLLRNSKFVGIVGRAE